MSKLTDKDLIELGVIAKGDRVKLLAFARRSDVETVDREEKMKKLKEIVAKGKSSRVATKNPQASVAKKAIKPTLRFEFRWKHDDGKGYKSQRPQAGGGLRVKDIPRNSTPVDWIRIAEELFFPDGKNPKGNLEEMDVNIADFKDNILDLWDSITAEEYKIQNSLHTNRLVFVSTVKVIVSDDDDDDDEDDKGDVAGNDIDGGNDNDDDDGLFESVWGTNDYDVDADDSLKEANSHGLIGTSDERKMLTDMMQKEYEESLEADRAKQRQLETKRNDQIRKEELRESRKRRLHDEPAKDQEHITISIRHVDLGVISRRFSPDCKVIGIYDWVGSLALSPEHFCLTRASPSSIVYPDEDAKPLSMSMLYMQTRDEPLPLAKDDEEVQFYSGIKDSELDVTMPLNDSNNDNGVDDLSNILEKPPAQLLEEDKVPSSEEKDTRNLLEGLQNKRRKETDKLLDEYDQDDEVVVTQVSRHNCVEELLNLYNCKTKDITLWRRPLVFKQEDAVGDGVCREVYSVFWDSFVNTYCEGVSQFTLTISPTLTMDDYVCLGRLYTHQFIQTGTIPLQMSEAIIQQAVTGAASEECLIHSFKMLLHDKEREIVDHALHGRHKFPEFELINILSDYNVTTIPKPGNIREVLLRVAKTELISKPYVCIVKLKEGMGEFWNTISGEEIHALYKRCTPTTFTVVDSLYLETQSPQAEKVLRWLVRYLENQDQRILSRFFRFCTGCDLVDRRIMVRLQPMSELAMRPKSQTCFGILTLPSNYRSYVQLADSINFYKHNPQMWELNDPR